ncbi:MAG: FliM/FliN family flagellar motor switch protein [Pseudomonadota bacterium]
MAEDETADAQAASAADETAEGAATAAGDGEELLSEDEKAALLDGVTAGVIGAESGDTASSVSDYVIRPDAYINYGSYPRLQGICQQWAKRASQNWSALLKCPLSMTAEDVFTATYATAIAKTRAPVITSLLAMAPLPGHAVVIIDNNLLAGLVEAFFGFVSHESDVRQSIATEVRQQFTPGELRVSELALAKFVDALPDAWEKLIVLQPSVIQREFDPTLGTGVEPKDRVIVCKFLVQTGTHNGYLDLMMPHTQIQSIADDLEGATNARNPDGDPHWREALGHSLEKTDVSASVMVGRLRLPLRRIVSMQPGDLLPLQQPEAAKLLLGDTLCALGSFGTLEDKNAFQLRRWASPNDMQDTD